MTIVFPHHHRTSRSHVTHVSTELNSTHPQLSSGPLDASLTGQAPATDPSRRTQLVAQAQLLLLLKDYSIVPVVELSTVLGVGPGVGGIWFNAS